jgi:hypothetical protein
MPIAVLGGLAVAGAVTGAIGSSHAANERKSEIDKAIAYQQQTSDRNRSDLAPFRTAGTADMTRLNYLLGTGEDPTGNPADKGSLLKNFTPGDLQNEPGYQFNLSEGQKAINRAAAARGDFFSGGTVKALDKYSQGQAENTYQDAFNRYNQNRQFTENALLTPAQMGLNATEAGVNAAQQGANAISGLHDERGQAAAAGTMGITNAIQGGINGIGSAYTLDQMGLLTPNGGAGQMHTPDFSGLAAGTGVYSGNTADMAPPQISYGTTLPQIAPLTASTPPTLAASSPNSALGAYMNPAMVAGNYFQQSKASNSPLAKLRFN